MNLDNYINDNIISFDLYYSKAGLKHYRRKFKNIGDKDDHIFILSDKEVKIKDIVTIHKSNGVLKLREAVETLYNDSRSYARYESKWEYDEIENPFEWRGEITKSKEESINYLLEQSLSLYMLINILTRLKITYNLKQKWHMNIFMENNTKTAIIVPKTMEISEAKERFTKYPIGGTVTLNKKEYTYPEEYEYHHLHLKKLLKRDQPEFKNFIERKIPKKLEVR